MKPLRLFPGVQGASPSVGLLLLLHVQEDDAEDEEPEHHGEGAGVVRVGRGDEALVLRVLQRPHRHLPTNGSSAGPWPRGGRGARGRRGRGLT